MQNKLEMMIHKGFQSNREDETSTFGGWSLLEIVADGSLGKNC